MSPTPRIYLIESQKKGGEKMAVQSLAYNSRLILRVQVGIQQGNPVLRNRSFNNVKADVSDEAVYTVAQALGSLQKFPVVKVIRTNDEELSEA
jgi:hypothetical protein